MPEKVKKTSTVRLNREKGEIENKPNIRPQKGPLDINIHNGHIIFDKLSTEAKIIIAEKEGFINRELSLILQDILNAIKGD